MANYLDRLKEISIELKEILKLTLDGNEPLPSGFLPKDKDLMPPHGEGQEAFKLIMETHNLFHHRDRLEQAKELSEKLSIKLNELSMRPEISENRFRFKLDEFTYEMTIERNTMVFFSVYKADALEPDNSLFMGTSPDLATAIRLLEFFRQRMEARNELDETFVHFHDKVKAIADKFRPNWKHPAFEQGSEADKSIANLLYITDRDAVDILKEFEVSLYGKEGYEYIEKKDLEGLLAYTRDLLKNDDGHLYNEQDMSGFRDYFTKEISPNDHVQDLVVNSPEVIGSIVKIVQKYTLENKLKSIQRELRHIQDEQLADQIPVTPPVPQFLRIQKAMEVNNFEETLESLMVAIPEDQERLKEYLAEKPDVFFKKRSNLFASLLMSGRLILGRDLLNRILQSMISEVGDLLNVPIQDEALKNKLNTDLGRLVPDITQSVAVNKEENTINTQEWGDKIFEKYHDQIMKVMNENPDADIPEKFAKLMAPIILSEMKGIR